MTWLMEHVGTIIVCLILLAVIALAIRTLRKDKAQGKSSCGAGCAGCAMRGSCHGGKKA